MVTGQCGILVVVDTFDDADVAGLVMAVARRIRRTRMERLAPYGLSPHQAGAFLAIARHRHHHGEQELRLSDLARRLRIAPRSTTEVVDALCERGLIQREPSATDRRATSLVLTAEGEQMLAEVGRANPGAEVFAALSAPERADLAELLGKALGPDHAHRAGRGDPAETTS